MKPDTRKEPRIAAVVPIRISSTTSEGEKCDGMGHTLNLSLRGARLSGLSVGLRAGAFVRVFRGRVAANFRVVWVSSNRQHAGVESMDTVGNIWGIDQWKTTR
jgi:hypothetical protein